MGQEMGRMLFRCVFDSRFADQHPGVEGVNWWEPGKVYFLESDAWPLRKAANRFEQVDAPPECHTPMCGMSLSELVEKCEAFIAWMEGEVVQNLHWVSEEVEITFPDRLPVRAANRPVSAKELVQQPIGDLHNAACRHGTNFSKSELDADSLDKAIAIVKRIRDRAQRRLEEQGRSEGGIT